MNIKPLTLKHIPVANQVLQTAYNAVNITGVQSHLDVTTIIVDMIVAVVEQTPAQFRTLIVELTDIPESSIDEMSTVDMVEVATELFRANKDFALLRLPPQLREQINAIAKQHGVELALK